jgi:prepilin-type N-terminal cleavage/methylation domain-containing protein
VELKGRSNGFSLLEVMIALSILGFGLLAASIGQLAAIKNTRQSRTQTTAMYLAREQMETFRSMSSDDVIAATSEANYPDDPNNPIDPDPGDDDSIVYKRRWIITEDDPEPDCLSIRVEVDWVNAAGVTRTTMLRSLKAEL